MFLHSCRLGRTAGQKINRIQKKNVNTEANLIIIRTAFLDPAVTWRVASLSLRDTILRIWQEEFSLSYLPP